MTDCRYYKSELPTNDDTVIVQIGPANEYGYKATLLEYNSIEGFVSLTELVHGRMKKKKVVKEGDIIPMIVVRVDKTKKYIDLSKKKLVANTSEATMTRYKYTTYLYKIGKEIYAMYTDFCKEIQQDLVHDLEFIMDSTIWRLYDAYSEETHDKIYLDVLNNPKILFESDKSSTLNEIFSPSFIEKATANISSRIIRNNMMQEAAVHLLVLSEAGVNEIKEILAHGVVHSDYKITILINAPPVYNIRVEGPDEAEGKKILELVVSTIQQNAERCKAEFKVTDEVKTLKIGSFDIRFFNQQELGIKG